MKQILVYADSLTWGIIPGTRERLDFKDRWPGAMETVLAEKLPVRVIENCLNGRRTVWEDPYKPGRNGLQGIQQVIEMHSPLSLVIIMLGTNDFQSMHQHNAWHAAEGTKTLILAIRQAPIEPGMPVPPVMLVAPPQIVQPRGAIAEKFLAAEKKCLGLAEKYAAVCQQMSCDFFDSNTVVKASRIDGIHLDRTEHLTLGRALAEKALTIIGQ